MIIDLRSDTVTKPTAGMIEAMVTAPLGDDVFDEDPTVHALESKAASIFGMEAALFCPSGTMTNQVAIRLLTQPQQEVICHETAHIYNYEGGGIAFNSLASVRLIPGERGLFTAQDVLSRIQPDATYYPETGLVAVENTSNKGGGACWELAPLQEIAALCQEKKLPFHLDGARLFNAITAKKQAPKDFGKLFNTISICLSKGLGTPIGSVLLFKEKAHRRRAIRIRKVLGGGMRQAGILAAAGIYALDNHVERLAQDHEHAEALAQLLVTLPWVEGVKPVETNIVIFRVKAPVNAEMVCQKLAAQQIKMIPFGPQDVRLVTHLDYTPAMQTRTLEVLKGLQF